MCSLQPVSVLGHVDFQIGPSSRDPAWRHGPWPGRSRSATIDIIVRGIGNASNFYGRAANYGTRPPHNGREVRAAVTQLDATALSSLPLLQIDSLQIVWYSNEEHGQCL